MARKGIPAFAVHSFVMTEPVHKMFLCRHEFNVLVYAASRVSAEAVNAGHSRLTGMAEWSREGKKSILHQIWSSSKLP
jgi:hypothetical protein